MSDESLPTPSRRRLWWIVGVSAAVVVALVAFFVLRDDGSSSAAGPEASSTQTAPAPTQTAPEPVESSAAATEPPAPTVDPEPPAPEATAPIGEDVTAPGGVTLGVDGLEQIDGDGTGPGEIDGPAVRFTLNVSNGSADELSMEGTVVNAYFGAGNVPGIQLSGSGSAPLAGSVPAGGSASGIYVFLIPEGQDTVTIEVITAAGVPAVLFTGPIPAR